VVRDRLRLTAAEVEQARLPAGSSRAVGPAVDLAAARHLADPGAAARIDAPTGRLSHRAILRLQGSAGNTAVMARLAVVQRVFGQEEIESTTKPLEGPETGPVSGGPAGAEGHEVMPEADEIDLRSASSRAEESLPPDTTPSDRRAVQNFLTTARGGIEGAEDAVDGVVSITSGAVSGARLLADEQIDRLGPLAGPQIARLGGMVRRIVAGIRGRIATVRRGAQQGIDLAVRGVRAAATFVRDIVGEAHRLIASARSGVGSAIARLRSLGSGIVGAVANLVASALSWARDRVGALLAAAARAGGHYLRKIRERVDQAASFVVRMVEQVVTRAVEKAVGWVEQQVARVRSLAMGVAAAARDAVAQAVARIARHARWVERRLGRQADRAARHLARLRARMLRSGLRLVRRVKPAVRAAVEGIVSMILEAIGRRAGRVEELVEGTRAGLNEAVQSVVDRAGALAGHAEVTVAVIESDVTGTAAESVQAATAIAEQAADAAVTATTAATSALGAGEGLLTDLAGGARSDAEQAQGVVSRSGR